MHPYGGNQLLSKATVLKKLSNKDGQQFEVHVHVDDSRDIVPAWLVHSSSTLDIAISDLSPSDDRAARHAEKLHQRRRELGGSGATSVAACLDLEGSGSEYESEHEEDARVEIESCEGSGDEGDDTAAAASTEPTWSRGCGWDTDPNCGPSFSPSMVSSRDCQHPLPEQESPFIWFLFCFPVALLYLIRTATIFL